MPEFPVQNPCPIRRLPPEILSEIFYRSLLEDVPTSPLIQSATDWALRRNASWGAIQGPREKKEVIQNTGIPQRSLALVCSAWRTLVYSTPTLWTIFKAEIARVPTLEALHRIHNNLSRAKSLPLQIYITAHDTNIPERSPILMEILSPFLSQIQFLALDMSFNLMMSLLGSTALDSGRIALPLLEELRLEEMWPLSSGGGDPDIPWKLQLSGSQETFFIHRSPHLRQLV
ncbi:hypothetical protein BD779DRAFT_1034698 [Infundibulicybe gibba]|nr:hypothetical protein BD779DRAFT_1034698 [Infundibulicybe gibba]